MLFWEDVVVVELEVAELEVEEDVVREVEDGEVDVLVVQHNVMGSWTRALLVDDVVVERNDVVVTQHATEFDLGVIKIDAPTIAPTATIIVRKSAIQIFWLFIRGLTFRLCYIISDYVWD